MAITFGSAAGTGASDSSLEVFNRQVYTGIIQLLALNLRVLNASSRGGITVSYNRQEMVGDTAERAIYKPTGKITEDRNIYKQDAGTFGKLEHTLERIVKVPQKSYTMDVPEAYWRHIGRPTSEPLSVTARSVADWQVADIVDMALGAIVSTYNTLASKHAIYGGSGAAGANKAAAAKMDNRGLQFAKSLFGDRMNDSIACWIMPSAVYQQLADKAIENSDRLHVWGTLGVLRNPVDPLGVPILVSDQAALQDTAASNGVYYTVGLKPRAISLEVSGMMTETLPVLGLQNIGRQWQAEWAYAGGMLGWSYNKTDQGTSRKSTTIAEFKAGANWSKWVDDDKNTGAVVLATDRN